MPLPSRHFLTVREKVEEAIWKLPEQEARAAALALVDDWAGRVMEAHIGSERFGLRSGAEFHVALTTPYFGALAAGPSGPPWAHQVEWLMRDRLRFWAERSSHFPTELRVKPASSSGVGLS